METKRLFGLVIEHCCDYYIPRLHLIILKPPFDLDDWDLGRAAGDGCFAIRTPWFMWYLE